MAASGRAAILTFKQIKQLGLTMPLIMGQSVVAKPFFEGIGGAEVADGLMVPIQLGSFGTKVGGDTAKFYAELEKGLGRNAVYYNTFGFDVGLITEAAVKNSDGTRQGIRDALEKVKGLPALNGPVTYTPEDHTGQNFEFDRHGPAGERRACAGAVERPRVGTMDFAVFFQLFLPGLTTGCVYALVALGFVLTANVSGVVNFAQGEFVMLGGIVAAALVANGLPCCRRSQSRPLSAPSWQRLRSV